MEIIVGYEKLEKNIDELLLKSTNVGFNIASYLLSDKDAVKKLIAQKNPKMSKEDIDLLVDDEEESLRKDDDLEEELKIEDNLEFEDFDFREDVVIGLPNIPDVTLSEEEKELRERQIEERREQKRKQREEKKKERQRDREIRRENRRKRIRQIKENFKEQLKEFWKEVKDLKTKIIQAVSRLFRESKELVRDLGFAVVEAAVSIPAIVVIFSTPPWNVAQAITLVTEVLLSYFNLLKKIQDFSPVLIPLKLLPLVTDRKNLTAVSTILNPILELVLKLWVPIAAIQKSIENLIKKLKELMGTDSRNRIFKKATRRLKKLGHIRRFSDKSFSISLPSGLGSITPPLPDTLNKLLKGRGESRPGDTAVDGSTIFAYDEEDVDEVRSIVDQFIINGDGSSSDHEVVDFRLKFDQQLSELEKELNDFDKELPVQVSDEDLSSFIYDVTLPDGTVIKNISEEGIEFFKQNYTLKFTNFTLP